MMIWKTKMILQNDNLVNGSKKHYSDTMTNFYEMKEKLKTITHIT